MKIVLLCSGNQNQIALANKIASDFNLAGIIVETREKKRESLSLGKIFEKFLDRTIFYSIGKAWREMLQYYKNSYPTFPAIEKKEVKKINSLEAVEFIQRLKPDLLMVSGTSILKKEILSLSIPKGIANLHTGLSPYVKGGPNCTNWCLAKNKFYLIGNTIMWIDAGIDSGNIISSEQTFFDGNETLKDVHIKVMEHAHNLYCRVVKQIEKDFENSASVNQSSISKGITYYSKQWNWKNKLRLLQNLRKLNNYIHSKKYVNDLQIPVTINVKN